MAKESGKILKQVFSSRSNTAAIAILLAIFVIIFIILFRGSSKVIDPSIRPDQIKIQKNDKIIIISEDGSVEYITPDGTFYETWDSARVSAFFKEIRSLAKANMNKPPPKEGAEGYWITLYIDGQQVKVFVEGTNELLEEVFEELEEIASGGGTPTPPVDFFSGNTPTPTSSVNPTNPLFPTPTPISGAFVGSGASVEEDCRLWVEQGLGSTVISNTVCIEKTSPTPTP